MRQREWLVARPCLVSAPYVPQRRAGDRAAVRRRKQRTQPRLVEGSAGLRQARPRAENEASPSNVICAAIGRVAAAFQRLFKVSTGIIITAEQAARSLPRARRRRGRL